MTASEGLPWASVLQRRVLASMAVQKQTVARTAPIRYKRCSRSGIPEISAVVASVSKENIHIMKTIKLALAAFLASGVVMYAQETKTPKFGSGPRVLVAVCQLSQL